MKKLLFFALVSFNVLLIRSDVDVQVLKKYRNRVFVNTGIGASINAASAMLAKFSELHLIEENEILFNHGVVMKPRRISYHKAKWIKTYELYHADSKVALADIIVPINEPITFFLSSCVPEYKEYDKGNGVLLELDQIMHHPIKKHTILIDYIHHEGKLSFGNITLESIKNKLLEINPSYRFRFERGGLLGKEDNAILVAYIPC